MSGRDVKKAMPVLKVHDGSIFTYIRFRHIHMQLCLIIQKSCCFIQQFSKKCIISSGDKTLDPSCEGMISHIEDHSTFFIVFGKLSAFWNRWFCRKAGASTPELADRKIKQGSKNGTKAEEKRDAAVSVRRGIQGRRSTDGNRAVTIAKGLGYLH